MNKVDVIKLLTILKASYPNFYKDMPKEEVKSIVEVWAMMFADDDPQLVAESLKAVIATSKFPPSIAEVKEKMKLILQPEQMTEIEAWNIVNRAIRNSAYDAQRYFDEFPPVIQRLVGSPNQLREWGQMDSETVSSVIQSNFMRSYKARTAHDRQIDALPESTKQLMLGLAEKFKMLCEGGAV